MYDIKTRDVKLELKQIAETGEFEGLAAVYNIQDEEGDTIRRGAFTRTIHHHKGKVPILWQHQINEPLGFGTLTDADQGLEIRGKLNLDVARARETHALMKQALAEGIDFGLSIGYDTIRGTGVKGQARELTELRLWEVSPTLFQAHPLATITDVKTAAQRRRLMDRKPEGKSFGEYADFADCVSQNGDKDDPEAFCAFLHHRITGEWPGEKSLQLRAIIEGIAGGVAEFKAMHMNPDQEERIVYVLSQLSYAVDSLEWPNGEEPDEAQALIAQALAHFDQGVEALHALLALDSEPSSAEPGDTPSDSEVASLRKLIGEIRADVQARTT
jgi:hypothetical protein